jgi:hypothetical protein
MYAARRHARLIPLSVVITDVFMHWQRRTGD